MTGKCVEAGVPFLFKQWGHHDAEGNRVRSKAQAGRELDGRLWNQYPDPEADHG